MRKSQLRLYAPFIALALLQGLIIILAPSNGADQAAVGTFGPLDPSGSVPGASGPIVDPETGQLIDPNTGEVISGGGGPAGTGTTVVTGSGPVQGDISHCRNGRQTDVIFNAPPCAPKFTGFNGGATYRGVTEKEILVINFQCQPDEQVNAILATQGLAATEAEARAMDEAAVKFLNEHYEFYGRTLKFKRVTGNCPLTPPEPDLSRRAAQELVKQNPFQVIHYATGPETHDVWSRNGIISLGGPNHAEHFYNGRRPFRWDIFPDGFEGADQIAEYYCKKLAGGTATHAGRVLHRTMPLGRQTPRKLAVIGPDNGNGASVPNAKRVVSKVEACSGTEVVRFTYASDISRAEEQARVTVAGLIDEQVTTVACMCDAIAPLFMTNAMTQNSYFPEHLMPGANLLDYDLLGRLYDPAQWNHAFGPSQLVHPVPFEQSDATKVWRAAGNRGQPCDSCNLATGYWLSIGTMIQQAGPNLNPLTVERGLVGAQYRRGGWRDSGGNNGIYLIKFGLNDYNAISDFREVYWSATQRSTIDGRPGAYVNMNGGKRYELGQLTEEFTVPVKSQ